MLKRKVRGKEGRNRFLWDVEWLVLRAGMDWSRWGFVHENMEKCRKYFQKNPGWVRAFRCWNLIHQMAGFTQHPDLIKEREFWRRRMREMDEGELSERKASLDMVTRIDMGLSAGELKRIRRRVKAGRPNWRWNPCAVDTVRQIDARLGKQKAYQ